jgi:hypothetical protein
MHESIADAALDAVCARWVVWHRMHRLLAPTVPKSILERMQPGKVRQPPVVGLSRELCLFNLAVNAQAMSPAKISFLLFYMYPARSVKEAAAAQGITRDAFYRRVKRFRRRAWCTACRLDRSQRQGERETTDEMDGSRELRIAQCIIPL